MKCPFCGSPDTQVLDSRVSEGGDSIRRRRRCLSCRKRFTTYETAELRLPQIVKQNGTRATLTPDTTASGAAFKRPEYVDQAVEASCSGPAWASASRESVMVSEALQARQVGYPASPRYRSFRRRLSRRAEGSRRCRGAVPERCRGTKRRSTTATRVAAVEFRLPRATRRHPESARWAASWSARMSDSEVGTSAPASHADASAPCENARAKRREATVWRGRGLQQYGAHPAVHRRLLAAGMGPRRGAMRATNPLASGWERLAPRASPLEYGLGEDARELARMDQAHHRGLGPGCA
jgi:hypothetical protein